VSVIDTPEWEQKIGDAENMLSAEMTEASETMEKHEHRAFRLCTRLLALVRVVVTEQETKFPRNRWPVVVIALFIKMLSILRAALTLGRAGHGREAPILTRAALEALITLKFIAQQDSALRARRWAEYGYVVKYKLMTKHPHLYAGPANRSIRRRVRDRARRAQRHFSRDFWGSAVGSPNLRDMAAKIGLLWYYDAIYWFGSQPTHASVVAVDDHIGLADDGGPIYKWGLSGEKVHRDMAAYCAFIIRGLDQLEASFHLGIMPIINDAKSEYRRTFVADPLA
jgi:hypothetical protein